MQIFGFRMSQLIRNQKWIKRSNKGRPFLHFDPLWAENWAHHLIRCPKWIRKSKKWGHMDLKFLSHWTLVIKFLIELTSYFDFLIHFEQRIRRNNHFVSQSGSKYKNQIALRNSEKFDFWRKVWIQPMGKYLWISQVRK